MNDKQRLLDRHNCQQLMRKVMLLLDGQMSEEEEKDFLENVSICNHCLESYQIEKNFKDYICNKVERKKLSEEALLNMRNQIKNKLGV